MKLPVLALTCLAALSLAACTSRTATPAIPTPTATSIPADDAAVKILVLDFGKSLQNVSLQAPDAAQQMQDQYAEFVSPVLLEAWMKDASKAPGRIVSSPWPDRIEISTLDNAGPDRYIITGVVVEITSQEVANGGAAARIPVRMVVEKTQGHWLITHYEEQR